MKYNKIKYLSIIMIFIICFITHYLYNLFPSFFTSLFFPVNESVWEHMKMLVSSIIIWDIILYFILKNNGYYFENFILSVLCTNICSIVIFLIIYYPLYMIFGDFFLLNIIILFVSIFLSVNIGFNILYKSNYNLESISILIIITIYILFGLFTYYPPKSPIFIDPRNNSYGINFD